MALDAVAGAVHLIIPLADGFCVFVPTGFIESAVTHKNWEGAGVQPNVATTAAGALREAYVRALAATKSKPRSPREQHVFDEAMADPESALRSSFPF